MPLRAAKDGALLPCGWYETSRLCLSTLYSADVSASEWLPRAVRNGALVLPPLFRFVYKRFIRELVTYFHAGLPVGDKL